MALHFTIRRWQDRVILLIGIWLILSPLVFGYPSTSAPAINTYVAGVIMALLAAFDHYKTYVWAVVLNIVIGAWVAVSPWLVGTVPDRPMTTSLLVSGIAAIVLGLWELRSDPELQRQWANTGATG